MDLKQLEYFVTTVKEGNISKAAQRLHISQPPLSTQLKLLEEELGVILFDRGARSIRLTDAGKIFFDRAASILNMADSAVKEMHDLRLDGKGTLRLGLISSAGPYIMEKIKTFHIEHPDIIFQVYEANTYELIELIHSGVIEVSALRTPFNKEGLEIKYIHSEAVAAIGKESFFEGMADEIYLEELKEKPLIIYRRWQNIIIGIFKEKGLYPHILCINDDARTTLQWAKEGMGIGLLPEYLCNENKDGIVKRRILAGNTLDTELAVVRKKGKGSITSKIAEEFMKHCTIKNEN